MSTLVRRVRPDEWREVRGLRIEALRDPVAAIAFLGTAAGAERQPDEFWQTRTRDAASGDAAAQFVARSADGRWLGTATVLRRAAGEVDPLGRTLDAARSDVVGVYVQPDARGTGVIADLFEACADWARGLGDSALTLDVHVDNARARRAYERCGFVETGVTMTGSIGPELEMRRSL
ncbi:GNAT family N-acetyltransferase [Microbacterium sp.]|uniref:GNAT family N-acetyltransferase n=1 Tax=Microbacterium sp. TaxID=51671 RepID=UPI0039E3577A